MSAVGSFETSVTVYETTQHHTSEYLDLVIIVL